MVQDVRELNRRTVLTELLISRPASRKQIAATTSISPATVTRVIDHLIVDGIVREGEEIVVESRGRRARFFDLVAERTYVLGIDLGASNTRLIATDLVGVPLAAAELPTPTDLDSTALALWLADIASAAARRLEIRIQFVALGLPGAVSQDGATVSNAPNLPQIESAEFLEVLRDRLDVPLDVDNDANFALIGEQRFGAARGAPTAAMVTLGAGFGAALAIGGKLLVGRHGLVGEFGQLPVGPLGTPLEHSVTGPGILRRASELGTPIESPAVLFAIAPDEPFSSLRSQFDDALLVALVAITASCEPEMIVFGGGISKSLSRDLGTYRSALQANLRFAPKLVPAALGDFSGAAGAVVTALHAAYLELGVLEEGLVSLPASGSLDLAMIHHVSERDVASAAS